MAISDEALDQMVAAGLSAAQVVAMIKLDRAQAEPVRTLRRQKNTERMRRVRAQVNTAAHSGAQQTEIEEQTQPSVPPAPSPPIDIVPDRKCAAHAIDEGAYRENLLPFLSSEQTLEEKKEQDLVIARAKEKKRGRKPSPKIPLPDDWGPRARALELGIGMGIVRSSVIFQADRMRNWAKANAVVRADWDAQFDNWLMKAASDGDRNGSAKSDKSIIAAISRQREKLGESAVDYEPELGPVLSLPAR